MICGIQDKCGMRASMTAELVFQERHSSAKLRVGVDHHHFSYQLEKSKPDTFVGLNSEKSLLMESCGRQHFVVI